MSPRRFIMVAVVAMCPLSMAIADTINVDVIFDKTGDAIVDGQDWNQMTDAEKQDYARQSVIGLGQDPDAVVENGKTRSMLYLEGLRSVYE